MTKKILLFHYFNGAGGKFIANCMSYSYKVAIPNYEKALIILENNNLNLLDNCLLATIPDKINSYQWLWLEQGCEQLFGRGINNIKKNERYRITELNDLGKLSNVWLPLVSHDIDEFNALKSFFIDHEIFTVFVDGTPEFIDLAIKKKWPKNHDSLDLHRYEIFKKNSELIKFDFTFNNWNPLIIENHNMIIQLADKIDCTFDFKLVSNYVKKYVNFHI